MKETKNTGNESLKCLQWKKGTTRGPANFLDPGMYRTLDAEHEVLSTIKRAEKTALLCLLRNVIGPTMVHVDSKGIILWFVDGGALAQELRKPTCGF